MRGGDDTYIVGQRWWCVKVVVARATARFLLVEVMIGCSRLVHFDCYSFFLSLSFLFSK